MDRIETLKRLKEVRNSLVSQTKLHSGLVSHNYIVEVGAYTVSKEDGKVTLKSGESCPSQWTAEGVKEIKEKCSWSNADGKKIEIIATPYKKWYSNQIEAINQTIDLVENIQ